MTEGPQLFRYLNFMLAFAAPQDSEKDLLARDANGHEVRVPLRLQAATDARADSGNGGLSEQLSATGNCGLLARSPALLASLMGR